MYMYKRDVALNNLQWLICHKTKPNHLVLFFLAVFYSIECNLVQPSFSQSCQ